MGRPFHINIKIQAFYLVQFEKKVHDVRKTTDILFVMLVAD